MLMPALASRDVNAPVKLAQAGEPEDTATHTESDDAPRRLSKVRGRSAKDAAGTASTPKRKAEFKTGLGGPGSRSDSRTGPRGKATSAGVTFPPASVDSTKKSSDGEAVPTAGPGSPSGGFRGTPAGGTGPTDAAPAPAATKQTPRPNGSNTAGPATARIVPRDEMKKRKSPGNAPAKKSDKPVDPAAHATSLLKLGDNLEFAGNYEGALDFYRQIKTLYPALPQAKTAAERIKRITGK